MVVNASEVINRNQAALFKAHNRELSIKALKKCNRDLRCLALALKRSKSSKSGKSIEIIAAINNLKKIRNQLKVRKPLTGSNRNRSNWTSNRVKWEEFQSAFISRIQIGVIINLIHKEPILFLEDCVGIFRRRINNILENTEAIKVNGKFCCEFTIVRNDKQIYELKYINTKNAPIYKETDLDVWFNENIQKYILKKLEDFQEKEGGWALSAIINLAININKFTLHMDSSYIQLPQEIQVKKACINVENKGNASFAWAMMAALFPARKDPQRTTKYPNYDQHLNLTNIKFPMTIKQIPLFEKQNNISINVYTLKKVKNDKTWKYKTVPTYLSNNKKEKHVNLLLIRNHYLTEDCTLEENNLEPIWYHYVWIKNLLRLLSAQLAKQNGQNFYCDRCLNLFYTPEILENHIKDCKNLNNCHIRLPSLDDKKIEFKNYKNKIKVPFIIYAELKCILVESSSSNKYETHIPYSIGFYVYYSYDQGLSFYKSYRGEDCIEWFTGQLKEFVEDLKTTLLCALPVHNLDIEQEEYFNDAKTCHICNKKFCQDDEKVQDHCYLTGQYRGPAHNNCTINYQNNLTIPIVFNNLSGYDLHFILKNINSDIQGQIDLLTINKEKSISFTKHIDDCPVKFRFIDSFTFINNSLYSFLSSMIDFPILKSEYSFLPDDKLELLTRKPVCPYDYFNSLSKFAETCLPSISNFYNKLNGNDISEEDYINASKIWQTFNLRNLGEYSDLCLKTDILLLADIFENLRTICLETYELDLAHYFSLSDYSWEAMLKYTNVTLRLLTDIDMLMFIERGMRGGLSQCSKRYCIANNKYTRNYDPSRQSSFLMSYAINNQYNWAMSQFLPHKGFKWIKDIENFNIDNITDDSPIGYILEVDLEYPDDIHDLHKDLPFCPEFRVAPQSKQTKLMATLYNKTKYIIHYRNLKQALNHGLKLKKIHRIVQFNQAQWLKPYIDLNTCLEAAAKNDFEKKIFNLMNEAIFCKTIENLRKDSTVKLVTNWFGRYGAKFLISEPEFKASTIFNEDLVAIELNKSEIFFNTPICVGMCILDLVKTIIYEFHYDYMIPNFQSNCTICYTDNDFLIYEIKCLDLYDSIKRDCLSRFDTSDYPLNNIWNIPCLNKIIFGLMKDKNNGRIMTEFVGLRSKMYAIKVEDTIERKPTKDVKTHIVKNRLLFGDYVKCLEDNNKNIITTKIKQEEKVKTNTAQNRIALSPNDDKRFLLSNSYETIPWGHYKIMNID